MQISKYSSYVWCLILTLFKGKGSRIARAVTQRSPVRESRGGKGKGGTWRRGEGRRKERRKEKGGKKEGKENDGENPSININLQAIFNYFKK